MAISRLDEQNYVDLFEGQAGTDERPKGVVNFTAVNPDPAVDIFASTTDTTTAATDIPDDTNSSTTETTTLVPDKPDADILGVATDVNKGAKPLDLSTYYEDRLKAGKFVSIDEEGEDGSKKPFIPKTPEEFDEVIDIQVNYQLDQKKKELEDKWYQSKSPAWQAVAKYAELTDDPAELLPFIQGVKNIDSVEHLDPTDPAQAEQIVRARLTQRGDSDEIIQDQLDALKSTDKLTNTAQKYKPLILKQEKDYLARMAHEKQEQEREYQQLVTKIRTEAIRAIEEPIYGKQKLKQEEKAAIYDMIAIPSEETQGYAIYNKIDAAFEKGDFETLKQVALLLTDRESFIKYVAAGAADKTAEGLQRKLRVATDSRSSSSNNGADTSDNRVERNQYAPSAKFGRG